jgi:hypothetical protein
VRPPPPDIEHRLTEAQDRLLTVAGSLAHQANADDSRTLAAAATELLAAIAAIYRAGERLSAVRR